MATQRMNQNNSKNKVSCQKKINGQKSDDTEVNETIILKKDTTVYGCYHSIPCQMCNGSMLTRHRCLCRMPNSNIFDEELGYRVCGKAFCAECAERWSSENRTRCGDHLNMDADDSVRNVFDIDITVQDGGDDDSDDDFTGAVETDNVEDEIGDDDVFQPDYIRLKLIMEMVHLKCERRKIQLL